MIGSRHLTYPQTVYSGTSKRMDAEQRTDNKRAWYLGNTTVREAQRLRAGLTVLAASPLNGNLEGRERETAFARLLDDNEVLRIQREAGEDISDLGRKWRAAMMQLGFITPDAKRLAENGFPDVLPYSVTDNGRRLIASESLPAQQECFLRSLLAYQLPSPLETFAAQGPFSPLRIVLATMIKLETAKSEQFLSKLEMSAVELVTDSEEMSSAVERILRYRSELERVEQPRERHEIDARFLESANARQSIDTLMDYADSNFRYLRLTGLFKQEGKRLGLAPHRRTLIDEILRKPFEPRDGKGYFAKLWQGAELPTDNRETAIAEARETAAALETAGVAVRLPRDLDQRSVPDIQRELHDLEEQLLRSREKRYANDQRNQWENIADYLDALLFERRPVPPKEAPAYFEWAIWRAFLAINSLVSEPWECRNFQVYEGEEPFESFLPVGCARSGKPDLVFEFENFALVVEVTLTSSSRQEAAEGEPVRRHVAHYVAEFAKKNKPVYGLFLSVSVDTNTAETFRLAKWYGPEDAEVYLQIVPLTLQQFTNLFKGAFGRNGSMDYMLIETLLRDCLADINSPAPLWKRSINQRVERFIASRFQSGQGNAAARPGN
jgi:hypothetical protein